MNSNGIPIRDSQTGKTLFYLDAITSEKPRDVNGRPTGSVKNDGDITLTKAGAALMSGRDVARDEHGKLVLMDLAPGDVASATANRANFVSTANDFIADRVAPLKFIDQDRGQYLIENPADSIQQNTSSGAAGAPVQTADITLSKTPFLTALYGFGSRIARDTVENADFDLKVAALRRAVLASRIAREIRVANMILNSASWATANVVAAAAKWNGGVNPDPLTDICSARAKSWLPPTTLVISEQAEQYLYAQSGSSRVRDFIEAGGKLPEPLIGRSRTLTAGVPAYIWSPPGSSANAVLLRAPADPKTDIGTARTLRWSGHAPNSIEQDGILVREYDQGEYHVVIVVCNDAEVMLQSPSNIGALITGILA